MEFLGDSEIAPLKFHATEVVVGVTKAFTM